MKECHHSLSDSAAAFSDWIRNLHLWSVFSGRWAPAPHPALARFQALPYSWGPSNCRRQCLQRITQQQHASSSSYEHSQPGRDAAPCAQGGDSRPQSSIEIQGEPNEDSLNRPRRKQLITPHIGSKQGVQRLCICEYSASIQPGRPLSYWNIYLVFSGFLLFLTKRAKKGVYQFLFHFFHFLDDFLDIQWVHGFHDEMRMRGFNLNHMHTLLSIPYPIIIMRCKHS